MTTMTLYICDRCKAKGEKSMEAMTFPVPTGHVTRTDAYEQNVIHLCDACHLQFNRWWMMDKRICLNPYALVEIS